MGNISHNAITNSVAYEYTGGTAPPDIELIMGSNVLSTTASLSETQLYSKSEIFILFSVGYGRCAAGRTKDARQGTCGALRWGCSASHLRG